MLALTEVATATLEAAIKPEGQERKLVGGGSARKLMDAVLQVVAQNSNQAQMSRQWQDTGLDLDAFTPLVRRSICSFLRFYFLYLLTQSLTHSLTHILPFVHPFAHSVNYSALCFSPSSCFVVFIQLVILSVVNSYAFANQF